MLIVINLTMVAIVYKYIRINREAAGKHKNKYKITAMNIDHESKHNTTKEWYFVHKNQRTVSTILKAYFWIKYLGFYKNQLSFN